MLIDTLQNIFLLGDTVLPPTEDIANRHDSSNILEVFTKFKMAFKDKARDDEVYNSDSHKFYTYININMDSPYYFYVGKGKGQRVTEHNTRNRSPLWTETFSTKEYFTLYLTKNQTKEASLECEQYLIKNLRHLFNGLATNVNLNDGGDGNFRYKKRLELCDRLIEFFSMGKDMPRKHKLYESHAMFCKQTGDYYDPSNQIFIDKRDFIGLYQKVRESIIIENEIVDVNNEV